MDPDNKWLITSKDVANPELFVKDFRGQNIKRENINFFQIKKDAFISGNGFSIPSGLVSIKNYQSENYLWSWHLDNNIDEDDYWCFICEDDGWIGEPK